ncbi:MAG: DUF2490 domain-containing protein [Paludibacteraceae bacterium]|nr:DUF2490 domain-containing protein [Paludibacteraceae bacterium]
MKHLPLLLLSLFPATLFAQANISEETTSKQSAEVHVIASFVKSFDHGLKLTLEEEIRSIPSHRAHTTISLAYTPIEYLSMSAGYVLKLYGNQGWDDPNKFLRHRVNIDATGQVTLGQWKLSLRERLMLDARADEIDLREKNRVDYTLRSRLQASYSIPNQPLSIVAKVEMFNTLNAPVEYINSLSLSQQYGQYINEWRPELGLQWKVDKKNTINVAYRYNYVYSRDIDIATSGDVALTHAYTHKHVILLTYKFDW